MPTRRIRHADIVRHFAERLRALRIARQMTQRDLADKAQVTLSYISTLESSRRAPGIDLVEKLARALGVHVTALLPPPPASEPPDESRQALTALLDTVAGKAGPETLSLMRVFLERLADSSSVAR